MQKRFNIASVIPSTILRELADDETIGMVMAAELLNVPRTSLTRLIKQRGIVWKSTRFKLFPYDVVAALAHDPQITLEAAEDQLGIKQVLLQKNIVHWQLVWVTEEGPLCVAPQDHGISGIHCLYCNNQKVLRGFNDLKTHSPELAAEWDNSGVNELSSDAMVYGSATPGSWKCSTCCNIWDNMTPKQRTTQHKQGCPYCANRRVIVGFNDLATLYPELLPLWSPRNTYNLAAAHRKDHHWWVCSRGHETYSQVYKRIEHGCFQCNLKRRASDGEREMVALLRSCGYEVKHHDRTVLKGYEIDALLQEQSIGFEYNGDYHHSNRMMQDKVGMSANEYHEWKREMAWHSGVTLYFVWDYDWRWNREHTTTALLRLLRDGQDDPIFHKLLGPQDDPTGFWKMT